MTANLNNLLRLGKSQIKPAAEVLAKAFQDDPLFTYFIPDASVRKNKLPQAFRMMVRYGVLYGEVYATSPNFEGVAVWLPADKVRVTLWRGIRSGGLTYTLNLGLKSILRQIAAGDCMASMHRRHASYPHWYLFLLGVDPALQGKGYASTLLRAMLARTDGEHLPCYLDNTNEKNVSMYQHFGFRVIEEYKVPNTQISIWAMLREPTS